MILNPQFEKFLKHFAVDKNEKLQLTRLKVQQRRGLLGNNNYNNRIRSGASLSFVSSSLESNQMPLAGERYSSMCENEKMKVRRIMKDLFDTFNSSASSTLA
jgi:hypothetical protein